MKSATSLSYHLDCDERFESVICSIVDDIRLVFSYRAAVVMFRFTNGRISPSGRNSLHSTPETSFIYILQYRKAREHSGPELTL